jgi:adenosylcobinamide kinase/adenosylcobinamide-phosphate guanylyltransferase
LGELVLVLGGARSGKSAFAERLAAESAGPVLYVATGQAGDPEMAARIAAHRERRPADWFTVEEPLDPAAAIAAAGLVPPVVLLDCVGMLITNILLADSDMGEPAIRVRETLDRLVASIHERDIRLLAVSIEAGSGMLPLTPLGRRYLDLLGDANQWLASVATRTYLVVAGLAVDLHRLARESGSA